MRTTLVGLSLVALAACAPALPPPPATATLETVLRDAEGREVGRARWREDVAGVLLELDVQGLPPGAHGIHLHAVGVCQGPDFASAGPHWNPLGRQHGFENPRGYHLGDLWNLEVGPDGRGRYSARLPGRTLAPGRPHSVRGRALVLHAQPDDYRTDPAGNSGARIACGVVG